MLSLAGAVGCSSPTPGPDAGPDVNRSDIGVDGTGVDVTGTDVPGTDSNRPDSGFPPGDSSVPLTESCPMPFAACTPAAGTTNFVRLHGTVVTPDTVHCDGDVLYASDTGHIVCAGPDCSTAAEAAGAQVVCTDGLIYPGLIDPHQHMDYNHLPLWRHPNHYDAREGWRDRDTLYDRFKIPHRPFGSTMRAQQALAERYAEVRLVMAGIIGVSGTAGNLLSATEVAGWVRNLDSTNRTNSGFPDGIFVDPDIDPVVVSTLGVPNEAMTATHLTTVRTRMASATYRAFVPHIAEGMEANARSEFDVADRNGVITNKTSIVHCTACSTPQFAQMGRIHTDLIWSPQSNIDLYGITANVTTAHRLGVTIALGVDWTPSGSLTQLEELACVQQLNNNYYDHEFTDRELVQMVTSNAAASMNMDDQLGRLQAGYWADLTVVAGDRTRPYRALIDARPEQIRLVVSAGHPVYGDTAVLSGTALLGGATCMALPDGLSPGGMTGVCGVAKSVCTQNPDVGALRTMIQGILTMAQGADAACSGATPTGDYCYGYNLEPLFHCDGPHLDRCHFGHEAVPRHRTEGTIAAVSGTPVAGTDDDGDGVPNGMDNCPRIFNPPFDTATMQDDADGDGTGDACDTDPCHATAGGADACMRSGADRDGDTIPDATDNCPDAANMNQADMDTDGHGDACDACPTVPNMGTMACPAMAYTIPTLRNPMAAGHPNPAMMPAVMVTGAVVTGVKSSGTNHAFFIQDPTATSWGGIYVFVGTAAVTVVPGNVVTVQGAFTTFSGLDQIDTRTGGSIMMTGTAAVPAPIVLTDPQVIATGGARAAELQSMRVTIGPVTTVTASTGTTGDFHVASAGVDGGASSLIVTSFIASDTTSPSMITSTLGQTFTSITGLVYANGGNSKLAPLSTADLMSP